jgi:hypothetical protein
MNKNTISKLILKASKLKREGKHGEYLKALRGLRDEITKQKLELEQGIRIVNEKIAEAERR